MNLKTIEMTGFKSFAEKTIVELKAGITGVVGPNGCGKSNVIDALRWCLGEMSPRSLRSKQMLDVIFAGAAGRAPLNMAEVTLTFDNSHHLLPIDYSEVQVTRRLFRSGESEYFLNKTQCRLKDIRDLFLDTGMAEGYSILAQGEVDLVINAKPEERRELFEEAAGISKYKIRREESLRKLEKTDIDLNRLNDIITMVKQQMDALESAAKKAKVFQELKEELKNLEIIDFLNRLTGLDQNIQTIQTRLSELSRQNQQITIDLDRSEADWTQNRVEQDQCEKELYQFNTSLFELDKQITLSDQTLKIAGEREAEFSQKMQKDQEHIRHFTRELAEIEIRLKDIRTEVELAQKQRQELKDQFEKEKTVWQSYRSERETFEIEKNKKSQEIFHQASEINRLKNEQNKSHSLVYNKEIEIASANKELEKAQLSLTQIEKEIETLNQAVENLKSEGHSLQSVILQFKDNGTLQEEKKKRITERIAVLRRILIEEEAHLNSLKQSKENDSYRKGTEAILKQDFSGLRGVVGLLFKYSPNAGQWIESALGQKINYLVFDRQDQAEPALDWLKQNQLGRAVCIILDKIPQTSVPDLSQIPNANSLLHYVNCDPELEVLKRYLLGSAFVAGNMLYDVGTIDGGSDLIPTESLPNGSFSPHGLGEDEGGGNDNLGVSKNSFLVQEKLQTSIRQGQQELQNLEEELLNLDQHLAEHKEILVQNETQYNRIQLQENYTLELLSRKNQELDLCQREIHVLKQKQEKDEQERIHLVLSIENLQVELNQLLKSQQNAEQEREELQKKIEEKRTEEHQSALTAKESEIRLETFEAGLRKSEHTLSDWEKRLQELQNKTAEANAEIEYCRLQIRNNQELQKQESTKIQQYHQQKVTVSAQVEELLKKKSGFEEKNRVYETSLHSLRETQKQISESVHQVEMELRTLESEKKNILDRMQEVYQMTPEAARETTELKPVDPESLARLKKRVENMSNSVNLEAPEQYKALQERYAFLSGQLQDLQKAKEDLKTAIHQINTATREQFKETFVKVRENFIQVFSLLFSGGAADLVFTDEQNLLETGIDIVAQPPGKKLQNIALLSGGEKTLTAIALLFSFFMVKPSPICVMDEVDAPLDAANVSRFVNLLKDFSQKTQFLLVTHNHKTMEVADILYGVTMEQSGISKILSAKLRKESIESTAELATR